MGRIIDRTELADDEKFITVERMHSLNDLNGWLDYVHNINHKIIVINTIKGNEIDINDELTEYLNELVELNKRRKLLIEKLS